MHTWYYFYHKLKVISINILKGNLLLPEKDGVKEQNKLQNDLKLPQTILQQ